MRVLTVPLPWALRRRLLRLTQALSAMGARRRIAWLEYNPLLFIWYHRRAVADAPGVMRALGQEFSLAQRYVDVGAGSGAFAAEAQRQGREVVTCEHSWLGRLMARAQDLVSVRFELAMDPPAQLGSGFHLAYCFEVAEHLEPMAGEILVRFLSGAAPFVVFTAAPPGQGGTGHLNEQPPAYWIERFRSCGMYFSPDRSARLAKRFNAEGVLSPWLSANVMVFETAGPMRAHGPARSV